jgi:hypothetical protein
MIKQVSRIDGEGFFVEPVIIDEKDPVSPDLIEIPVPEGFYKPRWDGTQWVEGLTPEEIEELKRLHQPQPSEEVLKQRLEVAELAIVGLMDYV